MYSDRDAGRRSEGMRDDERYLDRGDAQTQRRRAYERKSRIFKRNREQRQATPEQTIVQTLLDLSEKPPEQFEQHVGAAVRQLQELIQSHSDMVQECLVDCIVELPVKTPHFATLTRLIWAGSQEEWVVAFVKKAEKVFTDAMMESSRLRSRMLLRFFVCLVATRVVAPESVTALMHKMIDCASAIARSSDDPSGRSWQPYTDFLVSSILIALPWGAVAFFGDNEERWETFSSKIEAYMTQRAIQRDPALSPFLAPIKESDTAALSDSGGASFLSELWAAIQDLRSINQWQCKSIPAVTMYQSDQDVSKPLVTLESCGVPECPPGCEGVTSIAERAALLRERYPPRGGIQLLEPQHTHPDALDIDKIIVEDYILDTLFVYQGNRVDCVRRIAQDIPSPFPIYPLAAQTLFSQLLLLPKPPLQPVAYSAVIINLCKAGDDAWSVFPRGLSACVREVFARMSVMDPELSNRTADWLALHLSNLGLMWPWSKWKKVLDAPDHNAQKLFVRRVLRQLVDLAGRKTVHESLSSEPEFTSLLPPEAVPKPFEELFSTEKEEADVPEVKEEEDRMEVDEEQQPKTALGADAAKFNRLGELIAAKTPATQLHEEFASDFSASAEQSALFMMGFWRVLLLCGDKNVTHTDVMLNRYGSLMEELMQKIGPTSQEILVDGVMEVWASSLNRACLILPLLGRRGMLSASVVVERTMKQIYLRFYEESNRTAMLWDVLDCGLQMVEAAFKDAEKVKADAVIRVHHAQEVAQDAAKRAAEAAERLESGNVEHVQDMLEAINEANAAEETARADVTEAEARLHSMSTDVMQEASNLFQQVFTEVFQNFLSLLATEPEPTAEDSASSDYYRAYYRSLARLGALCRRYSGKLVGFLDVLEGLLESAGSSELIREVVWNSLGVGKEQLPLRPVFEAKYFTRRRESTAPTAEKAADAPTATA